MDEDSYLESVPAGRVALEQWLSVLERRRMRVSRVVAANRLVAWAFSLVPRHAFGGFPYALSGKTILENSSARRCQVALRAVGEGSGYGVGVTPHCH
jgi:hypothetical protein